MRRFRESEGRHLARIIGYGLVGVCLEEHGQLHGFRLKDDSKRGAKQGANYSSSTASVFVSKDFKKCAWENVSNQFVAELHTLSPQQHPHHDFSSILLRT
jgi:hypothetical protein